MSRSEPQFLTIAIVIAAGACYGQPKGPCFAFLLNGDVTTVCRGRTKQITHCGDIENFAVSDELSSLAYVASRYDATKTQVGYTTTVVNLKTKQSKQVEDAERVVSTCGGILPNQIGPDTSTRDVVTGEVVRFPPYVRFRCSSDRRVVAGITHSGDSKDQMSDLYEGVLASTRIAAAGDVYVHYFNVSPDGSEIAWFNDVRPLCIHSGPNSTQCVDHSTISDPVSVNNSGEVLVATGTGHGCVYKTGYNFQPARLGPGDDECLGIGYWKPGMKSIVFIEPLGRNPQWLSPETADLLGRWSVRMARSR